MAAQIREVREAITAELARRWPRQPCIRAPGGPRIRLAGVVLCSRHNNQVP
jgi:hypothetical protein